MNFIHDKIKVICEKLFSLYDVQIDALDGFEYVKSDYKTSNIPPKHGYMPFSKNTVFNEKDAHFWFHKKFKTPTKLENSRIYFNLDTANNDWDAINPQGLVYLNGKIVQGLDINHKSVTLEFDTEYDMYIYMYTGMYDMFMHFIPSLHLVNTVIEKLYYDIHVPYEAAMCFGENDINRIEIIKTLETALYYLDLRVPLSREFFHSIEVCEKYLHENFYEKMCGKTDITVNCTGHTHIDVAWHWQLRQTAEKVQRSFATVLNLMKEYPEYKFMSSQPQLYKYVKDHAPELFVEIKQAVKNGTWEPEGAMWVEADCNLISGESFIRQIMLGKKFMNDEFGVDNKILWLPDVFGYSAAMPQILKKCGIEKFVTSKISWNETNKMPYDSFMWEGIDGSEIFTYFITAQDLPAPGADDNFTTYSGYIRPSQVLGTYKRFQQKEYSKEAFIPFGYGDGGGGPTRDMLEQGRRLAYGIPGFPKTKMSSFKSFLDKLYADFEENSEKLHRKPRWVGELYLEFHRGTYTSIAKNKKNNRKSEFLYQKAEALSVMDMLLLGGSYPQDKINKNRYEIAINQFHDIIPGSSIKEVYDDSDVSYAAVLKEGNEIADEKLNSLTANVKTDGGIFVYNPNSFMASDIIEIDSKKVMVHDIPPLGYKVINPEKQTDTVTVSDKMLENKFYKIVFDDKYNIISLYDKQAYREIAKGKLNELQLFEDYPKQWDAWEITDYYKDKMYTVDNVEAIEIIDDGICGGFKITRKCLNSKIIQNILIYSDVRRIDFDTEIDWKEEHLLLKAAFPVDVHANEAAYDIQFGSVKRPTHANTSWDKAKFEVCAHKWADISEDDYGVSLINDCKYGYSAEGSTLKLTLLKCATNPNPAADKEIHKFRYSLLPHIGNFKEGKTVQTAYLFNCPLSALHLNAQEGILPESYSFASCDKENIIIETIKKAETGNDVIMRMYEAYDRKVNATIALGFTPKKAYICDMLENNLCEITVDGNKISLPIKNFEIVTIKLEL